MAMTIFSTMLNINEAIKQIYHTIRQTDVYESNRQKKLFKV